MEKQIYLDEENSVASEKGTVGLVGPDHFDEPSSNLKSVAMDSICLKVKDVLGITPLCGSQSFIYNSNTTIGEVLKDVERGFQMDTSDFELIYQDKLDIYEFSQVPTSEILSVVNIIPSNDKEYTVTISSKTRTRRNKKAPMASPGESLINEAREAVTANRAKVEQDDELEGYSAGTSGTIRRDFVGLKNTNMTCYLNSVIQSLWLTPEFRNSIYFYQLDTDLFKKRSIGVPLQKLFLQLQLSTRESVGTEELTRTFGWNTRDTWNQHDVEELLNLLMDHLSVEFKGTRLEGTIETMYFGTFTDYVTCLECDNRSMRESPFLVIPLPIKPFQIPLEHPTLEEALKCFILPEVLDGNNKYSCGKCDKPCDAKKGLIFKTLPYILTIQLKRFEYNWSTGRRKKLNDRVEFPMVLDMNAFLDRPASTTSDGISDTFMDIVGSKVERVKDTHSRPSINIMAKTPLKDSSANSDIGLSEDDLKTKLQNIYETNGRDVYLLYAVLVHRGGLMGGHYFAYILDFETFTWHRCDDNYVRKADVQDIEMCFGGDLNEKEPTSAYMLMYRRYDPIVNAFPLHLEQMPPHTKNLWQEMSDTEKELFDVDEMEKNCIKLKACCRVKGFQEWKSEILEIEVFVPKSATWKELPELLHKNFYPNQTLPNFYKLRVSRYDRCAGLIENSFENMEDNLISHVLKNPPPKTEEEVLILEIIRNEGETFPVFHVDDCIFITRVMDGDEEVLAEREIHFSPYGTPMQLKAHFAKVLELNEATLIVIIQKGSSAPNLEVMDFSVPNFGDLELDQINHVYAQSCEDEQLKSFLECADVDANLMDFQCNVLKSEEKENTAASDPAVNFWVGKRNMKILKMESEGNTLICRMQADRRLSLGEFSTVYLSAFGLKEDAFILYMVVSGEEIEILPAQFSRTLDVTKPFDKLIFRYGRRLKVGEGRVAILLLDLLNYSHSDNEPTPVGEVIIHIDSGVLDATSSILEQLKEKLVGRHTSQGVKIRLRKRIHENPAKILNESSKISDYYSLNTIHGAEMYLQVIDSKEELCDNEFPIVVRRWRPSLQTLEPPLEIVIFHDHTTTSEVAILNKLRDVYQITEDNLEVSRPESIYPYEIEESFHDLSWFPLTLPPAKSMYLYSHDLALYVRDKTEELCNSDGMIKTKTANPTIKLASSNLPEVKKETGIRINLSLSPRE